MPGRPKKIEPRKPGPKPAVDCGTNLAPHIMHRHQAVGGDPIGGVITGTTITVNQEIKKLTEDLTLIAEDDLDVMENIHLEPGLLAPNLTLVSLRGTVSILSGVTIHGSASAAKDARSSSQSSRTVYANPGYNGGFIKICGVNIVVSGWITGISGGRGGKCTVIVDQPPGSAPEPGEATAVGGCGGAGGDVLLCAQKSIVVRNGGVIHGAVGGRGGWARATAANGSNAHARAGDGGQAGSISFQSLSSDNGVVRVTLERGSFVQTEGPNNPGGGDATAVGGAAESNKRQSGGQATAEAGSGNDGAPVVFGDCVVDANGTLRSGDGGTGGKADASGGDGSDGEPEGPGGATPPGAGFWGGIATARGGKGGARPMDTGYLDADSNSLAMVPRGLAGHGGDAVAVGGSGGKGAVERAGGKVIDQKLGGQSGVSDALGGNNGDGVSALPDQIGRQPPTRAAGCHNGVKCQGGIGKSATSRGAQ